MSSSFDLSSLVSGGGKGRRGHAPGQHCAGGGIWRGDNMVLWNLVLEMRGWNGRGEGRNEREGKRRGPQGLVHTPCPKSWKIPIAKLIRLVGAAKPRDAPGSKHPRAATEFGWVPFADLRLRSLHDNEAERRIHGGWVKWRTNSKPVVDQSSWHFETMYETFCRFQRTCVYRFRFRRYRPLKLPLSCKIVEKGSLWAPDF